MNYLACILLVVLMSQQGLTIFVDCGSDSDCQVHECCTYDPRPLSVQSCKPRSIRPAFLITKRDEDGSDARDLEFDMGSFYEEARELERRSAREFPCERFRYCKDTEDCLPNEFCDIRYNEDTLFSQGICLVRVA